MNGKITLRQLADRLPADIFGKDADARVAIVSEIFALAGDTLASGEEISLPGIGLFSLTGDPSDPVAFTPDRSLAETVNAPFASFKAVELAPEVTDSMLDRAGETADAEPDPAGDIDPEPLEEPSEGEGMAVAEPVVEVAPVEAPAPEPQPRPEPQPAAEPEVAPVTDTPAAPSNLLILDPVEDLSTPDDDSEAEVDTAAQSSRFGVGFFCGLLTGLVIGAILFLVYVMVTSGVMQDDDIPSEAAIEMAV